MNWLHTDEFPFINMQRSNEEQTCCSACLENEKPDSKWAHILSLYLITISLGGIMDLDIVQNTRVKSSAISSVADKDAPIRIFAADTD